MDDGGEERRRNCVAGGEINPIHLPFLAGQKPT
jgi:hypothetical protein